ncbi:hypothetical protein [Chromobacterium subtsugae]|uniref:hypothetical protein n=1 Tax=Chromobacterium subtsugae TaxID=251747 RepID=UPI00128B7A70|nr:hypothetical protein [Chromobacterium subtsugae]
MSVDNQPAMLAHGRVRSSSDCNLQHAKPLPTDEIDMMREMLVWEQRTMIAAFPKKSISDKGLPSSTRLAAPPFRRAVHSLGFVTYHPIPS